LTGVANATLTDLSCNVNVGCSTHNSALPLCCASHTL